MIIIVNSLYYCDNIFSWDINVRLILMYLWRYWTLEISCSLKHSINDRVSVDDSTIEWMLCYFAVHSEARRVIDPVVVSTFIDFVF